MFDRENITEFSHLQFWGQQANFFYSYTNIHRCQNTALKNISTQMHLLDLTHRHDWLLFNSLDFLFLFYIISDAFSFKLFTLSNILGLCQNLTIMDDYFFHHAFWDWLNEIYMWCFILILAYELIILLFDFV